MASVGAIISKLRWSLAQRGVLGSLQFALGRIAHKLRPGSESAGGGPEKPATHPFDLEHGVDTSGLIGGGDLRSGHPHDIYNTAYYGMSPSRFAGAISRWRIEAAPGVTPANCTFVDLGCGKGRAVLMAAALGFREVIGVELNPALAGIATENLERWRRRRMVLSPVTVICGDATEFRFPDGPCLLYLFNPFAEPVVKKLLSAIEQQFQGRPGNLDVLYFNPESGELFENHSGFRLAWREAIPMSGEDATVDMVASEGDLCDAYRWVGSGPAGR